jgi:protein required for attachment to host cells
MKLRIPHDAAVVVCDGKKALFLRNEGDEEFPNLKVDRVAEAAETGRTGELGTDKPGRTQNVAGPTSAMEATDWHARAERHFAEETARAVAALHDKDHKRKIVLVAPPKTLAALRETLGEAVQPNVLAEIDKDLTHHPVHEIERLLTAA